MPTAEDEDVDEEYHGVKTDEEAPVEEAPAVEADPAAVSDAMAELYPEAAEQPAEETYRRRRKADEE